MSKRVPGGTPGGNREMKRPVASKVMILAGLILISPAAAFAQVQAGRIVGTVTDPNKAVVPNAKVVITNAGTNQAQNLTTNGAGEFVLTPVDPGLYHVSIAASGFRTSGVVG